MVRPAPSEPTPSRSATRIPARGGCRSARPRGRTSRRCPVPRDPDAFVFPRHVEGTGLGFSQTAGGQPMPTPSSASCAYTTSGTRRPARLSLRARTCRWSASCSGTGGKATRRDTATLPTNISSRRPRTLVSPLRAPCSSVELIGLDRKSQSWEISLNDTSFAVHGLCLRKARATPL